MVISAVSKALKTDLCISLIGPTLGDLREQLEKAVVSADLVELRLDKYIEINLEALAQLRRRFPIPMIFTLRSKDQGGDFQGTEEERLQLIESLLSLRPEHVDIEFGTSLANYCRFQSLSPSTQWIISWHDFQATPFDLEGLFNRMQTYSANYYKIATQVQRMEDALRLLYLAKKVNVQENKLCALGMGVLGHCTRILSPVFGAPFTFAALEEGLESAPGQLSAKELLRTYHFAQLNRQTQILGLIGDPVDKSSSHLTHNAVLRALNINGVYVKFKVPQEELPSFFSYAKKLNLKGLSVTMPHKASVIPFIDALSSSLMITQAVNTLSFENGKIRGLNTDGKGALKALSLNLQGKRIVIVGMGGTGKAIAFEAAAQGAHLTLINRTFSKAQELAKHLGCQALEWGRGEEIVKQGYDIFVQATPIGMAPEVDQIPVPAEWILPGITVLEVISSPAETRLLKEARIKKSYTISGLELFIHQAVAQFDFWFGPQLDLKLIETIIRQHLPRPQEKVLAVKKSKLQGRIAIPPSKSHSIRAVLLGGMLEGKSVIRNLLQSPDVVQAIKAIRLMGAKVVEQNNGVEIEGVAGTPKTPDDVIDVGNSGQVLRFAAALAALGEGYAVFTGDASIRSNRPVEPLIRGLKGLGAVVESTRQNGYAPFFVKGPLKPGHTTLPGEDSQPVSALLLASAFVEGETRIKVMNPGEKPWIELTLFWLRQLGVSYHNENYSRYQVKGFKRHTGFTITVPGDFSSAAFPLVAALLTQSELTLYNIDMDDVQGDKALIPLLQQMGACIEINRAERSLTVKRGGTLRGCVIDINPIIDAITILAVVGCFAEGETRLVNGAIARYKECDRIFCIASELKKMGANITALEDGLIIRPSKLHGAHVKSYHDHRMALSLAIAGLAAEETTYIEEFECMHKSYPSFIQDMIQIGAQFKRED